MNNELRITWSEIQKRLTAHDRVLSKVYGVPKGGMILCALLKQATVVTTPEEATVILDDLVDSGQTRKYYEQKYPDAKFVALFDKQKEHLPGWIVFPWEAQHPKGEDSIHQNIVRSLQYIGEDPSREGLVDTPKRVVKMYGEIFRGYYQTPEEVLTVFSGDGYDQIILLKDIELYSMCEHHMLPFFGKAHVAYIPKDKIVGISKLARLVDMFARRLQIQERIGEQVTGALMELLNPLGAACIIEATHMCMRMRGVAKQNSTMVTSSMKGVFLNKPDARVELLQLIKG